MTEKRYKLSEPNGAYLIDDDKPYAHWINDDDKIVDLLNSLADENKQLKHQNELLSDELEQCKAVIDKRWREYLKKKEELEND